MLIYHCVREEGGRQRGVRPSGCIISTRRTLGCNCCSCCATVTAATLHSSCPLSLRQTVFKALRNHADAWPFQQPVQVRCAARPPPLLPRLARSPLPSSPVGAHAALPAHVMWPPCVLDTGTALVQEAGPVHVGVCERVSLEGVMPWASSRSMQAERKIGFGVHYPRPLISGSVGHKLTRSRPRFCPLLAASCITAAA